ncbi:DNA-directed RNA polymerase subunit omega [Microvirga sp. Marseille-Q2068]|uniref:DNA-directed RNA polymerase subunit omega n=1 Tax=Microvirga mediterraneensis TaxID=2754695 RepID=A0A838BU57_9HYPH|nr:DNA-directed RNA polymerase subunit omega [Microvirga mediterraneensis]
MPRKGGGERTIPNRFELALVAAERAHQPHWGAEMRIRCREEPVTVLALR